MFQHFALHSQPVANIPVGVDDENYDMKHKRRGVALIFVHSEYENRKVSIL